MDKIKLLTYSVIALLLLNLATIGFVILSKPGDRIRPEPSEIIIEKLNFDENQQKEYEQLIHTHHNQINELDEKILKTKKELYLQLLKNEVETKTKDSLITNLSGYQKQIEATHFKHFQDIKNLCRKDQVNSFNELTKELSGMFSNTYPPKPPKD
jgi:hypothetical protein